MKCISRLMSARCFSTPSSASALVKRRRFYKDVGIVEEKSEDFPIFKITLDGRVLKTQGGQPLQIRSEPLALAVAEEWASQGESLELGHMRLTGLSYTSQDNPLGLTKESITSKILEYLGGDTVLYWNPEQSKLYNAQEKSWKPVIEYANSGLGTNILPVDNMFTYPVTDEDRRRVEKWCLSHNFWALNGLQYAVESIKSVILPYNVLSFNLTGTEAVQLATLEQRIQAETWGSVEFAHGVEEEELTSRLSAASLFVYFNSNHFRTSSE